MIYIALVKIFANMVDAEDRAFNPLFALLAAQALPPALARQGRLSNDQLLELSHWSPLAEQGSIWESHSSGHVSAVRSVGRSNRPIRTN